MGTTSEKLTYLNGTKQELKDKINNLGGSIDDNTTFRQYANQLQTIYDNLPKTEYQEGTEVNLGKTSKGKLDYENGVVGIGQTEQDSTQGYQLLNLPTFSQTQNGVEVEYVGGIIKISGTATSSGTFFYTSHEVASVENGQAYTYSLTSNKTSTAFNFFLGSSTGAFDQEPTMGNFNLSNANPSRSKTMSASGTLKFMVFATMTSGTTYDLEVKPMFETGTTAHTWEKYTGGQASPNPSYPQTINSVTGNQDVVVKDENNNTIATYQLSLGDIQLNAIGNYKDELVYDVDEDKVYKNEKIGKYTFTGASSENWVFNSTSTLYVHTGITEGYQTDFSIAPLILSNYYISNDFSSLYSASEDYGISYGASSTDRFCIRNADITSVADFKTWLSTHNTIVYYILVTPTLIEITDTTLINQVKALYNAHSLNGTTIITSNGNLPLVIKVRGLKGE